jgi:CBS domain-containing protein
MRAHQIMTAHVIAVRAETTIAEAIDLMLRHHISGLPVVDDAAGKLIGIVSEGDFIRRAETGTQHKRGRWLSFLAGPRRLGTDFIREHGRKVGDIMTPNPRTVNEGTPLDEVVKIMEANSIKRLPVMRGEAIVGILTRSDFLPAIANLAHIPGPSSDDDHIRNEVTAALRQMPWRPCPLNVAVRDGIVGLSGVVRNESARKAAIVAAESAVGVRKVNDYLSVAPIYPAAEEDFGGGDFVSPQEQPSTADDEPL